MNSEFLPIMTKKQFVNLYSRGMLGNASPTWNTFTEFNKYVAETYGNVDIECDSPQRYHLRNRKTGGVTFYDLHYAEAWQTWLNLGSERGRGFYCSAMAPTELTLINGEVMQSEQGLQLFYSTVPKPMRDSLKEGGKQVTGVVASRIIQHFMNAKSWDWMQVLLDRYPFHVVEFSCYDRCWGTVPGFNTCFWEIRCGY